MVHKHPYLHICFEALTMAIETKLNKIPQVKDESKANAPEGNQGLDCPPPPR